MQAQQYVDKIAQARGFVPDFHRILAKHDFEVLTATDELTRAAILHERSIDRRTKELLFIVALGALRGDPADLHAHIRSALDTGITAPEVLEALEILIPLGGVVLFKEAFKVWQEATGADGIEPSPARS